MKKTNVILGMVCLIGLLATSCMKDSKTPVTNEKNVIKTSTALMLNQFKSTSYSGSYVLSSSIGHKSSECGGKCRNINGTWGHADCQGFGNVCSLRVSIYINKELPENPKDFNYIGIGINDYEPTEESTFNMPARSFYLIDEKLENGFIWINIPEQQLIRDEETNQFIYKDITFTSVALFENL